MKYRIIIEIATTYYTTENEIKLEPVKVYYVPENTSIPKNCILLDSLVRNLYDASKLAEILSKGIKAND